MTTEVATAWIEIIPTVLWILAAAGLVWYFHEPIVKYVFPRIRGVQLFGVQIDIATSDLGKAVEQRRLEELSKRDVEEILGPVQRRLELVGEILPGSLVLWVDDKPQNNVYEVRALVALGIRVDNVTTTKDAKLMLGEERYDLVISDIGRYVLDFQEIEARKESGEENEYFNRYAGYDLLEAMDNDLQRRTIFYTYPNPDLKPDSGVEPFAITTSPDDLFNRVLDILERYRSARYFEQKQRKSAEQQP